jgi:hypothetical protein
MNWGKGIVVAFVLFAALVASMVVISMRQDVSLVSKDYYKDEIEYQQLLDKKNNTATLTEKPEIRVSGNQLEITFPFANYVEKGELRLFRPSDARLDRKFQLSPSADSVRTFVIPEATHGAYRVKLDWRMEGRDYYLEQMIVI